jgi:hypothetical protein
MTIDMVGLEKDNIEAVMEDIRQRLDDEGARYEQDPRKRADMRFAYGQLLKRFKELGGADGRS